MNFEKLFFDYQNSTGYKKLSDSSKETYQYAGKKLIDYFGTTPVTKIKRSDFIRFQNEHSEKPAYANLAIRLASVVFSYAVDMDIVQFNPVARLRKMKGGSHEKWEIDEVKKVIALGDRRISTAVALAWYTGQREGDILSMQWKDYQGGYITVTQQKTNLEMKIKAHPDLMAYLDHIRGDEPPQNFIVSGKTIMSGQAFRGMLKRRTDALRISKVFHGIRKGVACALAENGRPISEIAAIMGHKSMRMAAYYSEQANSKTLTENAVSNMVTCI